MTGKGIRRARSPNRWLIYGVLLGAMLGWAADIVPVGLIIGLVVGIMLRGREIDEAAELAAEMAAYAPKPDDIVH